MATNISPELQLNILRILAVQPQLSQRALAQELGISLGSTNHCLRALIDRGLVKAKNFYNSSNKLSYAYLLTPAGVEHKARGVVRFLKQKKAEHRRLLEEIERLQIEVENLPNGQEEQEMDYQ